MHTGRKSGSWRLTTELFLAPDFCTMDSVSLPYLKHPIATLRCLANFGCIHDFVRYMCIYLRCGFVMLYCKCYGTLYNEAQSGSRVP